MEDIIKIKQIQFEELLREHANASFNFTLAGRYEWLLATLFCLVGIVLLLFVEQKLIGAFPLAVGIFELLKYSGRINRWVKAKKKEPIFNQEFEFTLLDDGLRVEFGGKDKFHFYEDMRACLISDRGILFKISLLEYYYISFKSIQLVASPQDVTDFVVSKQDATKLKIKTRQKKT